jgi:hypothetical protein
VWCAAAGVAGGGRVGQGVRGGALRLRGEVAARGLHEARRRAHAAQLQQQGIIINKLLTLIIQLSCGVRDKIKE